jgi:hypothetical protein
VGTTETSTSTSSTSLAVAPNAAADIDTPILVGQVTSSSVLANDALDDPSATLVKTDFEDTPAYGA